MNGFNNKNEFNREEFLEICRKYNTNGQVEDISIKFINSSYYNMLKTSVQKDRRGEVVFCVVRPDGKIITITCNEYPPGIYRIPTGGIGHRENIIEAVHREVREELGLYVRINKFAGVLRIRLEHADDWIMFYSYIFILDEVGGRLLTDASDDEISEVKLIELTELEGIVDSLNHILGKWSDWGKFRFITSNAVLKHLQNICI